MLGTRLDVHERRIIDACITCPWHGFQYRLDDGCAPAPFTEKLATYRVRLRAGAVEVDPVPAAARNPAAIHCPDAAGLRRCIGTKIPIAWRRN